MANDADGFEIKIKGWRMKDVRQWLDGQNFTQQYSSICHVVKKWPYKAPITPEGLDQLWPDQYETVKREVTKAVIAYFRTRANHAAPSDDTGRGKAD